MDGLVPRRTTEKNISSSRMHIDESHSDPPRRHPALFFPADSQMLDNDNTEEDDDEQEEKEGETEEEEQEEEEEEEEEEEGVNTSHEKIIITSSDSSVNHVITRLTFYVPHHTSRRSAFLDNVIAGSSVKQLIKLLKHPKKSFRSGTILKGPKKQSTDFKEHLLG
ncbi:hypothetical protein HZH66_012340 [Vespula vulgaris]|uniref:Uncharacterized protein n=1 Tax=Vespula vulgaris TaxID=7454 RepID=A0A834JBB8_VESVU|nr:hypothetical protein HZH66_012340 [Vespula vulgaris]